MSRTLFALALLLGASPALAAPLTLSNMGFLADAAGDGLMGDYELAFSLYDDADATNPALWTETHTVTFADGSYSVILGTSVAIDEALLDQYPLFLGLSVDGAAEMVPRHEVVSVPYSILSETSFNVDGGTVKATSIEGDSVSAGSLTGDTVTADAMVIGKTTIDGSGIHVDGSTVIDTSGGFVGESPAPPDLGCELGQTMKWSVDGWGCGSDDDSFAGADASAIESSDIANWNAAYDWTDHSDEGYLTVSDFAAVGRLSDSDSDAEAWEGQIHFVLADPLDPPQTPLSQSLLDELVKLEQTGGEVDPQFLAWGEGLDLEDPAALENHVKRWNRAYDEWDANSSTWDRAASFASGANRPVNGSISQADVAGWKALAQEFGPYDVDGLPYVESETDPEFSSFQTSGGEVNGTIDMGTNEITDARVGEWIGYGSGKVDLTEDSFVTLNGGARIQSLAVGNELNFDNVFGPRITLWSGGVSEDGYTMGIQPSRVYMRTSSEADFAWYQGGFHDASGSGGGTELMALDEVGLWMGGQFVSGPKIADWDNAHDILTGERAANWDLGTKTQVFRYAIQDGLDPAVTPDQTPLDYTLHTVQKLRDDTALKFTWTDSYRAIARAVNSACGWELRINDKSCQQSVLHMQHAQTGTNNADVHMTSTVVGVCHALQNDGSLEPLEAGLHNVKVFATRYNDADCYRGHALLMANWEGYDPGLSSSAYPATIITEEIPAAIEQGIFATPAHEARFDSTTEGWAPGDIDVSNCAAAYGSYLGGYGQFGMGATTSQTFDLSGISHSRVRIVADFVIIDSWDNESPWVQIDNDDATRVNLGSFTHGGPNVCGNPGWADLGRYTLSHSFSHTSDTLTVTFGSTLNEDNTNESWGIDNIRVIPEP